MNLFFYWCRWWDTGALRLICSTTVASQQYPSRTTRLKTVHRTVLFTPCSPSVFESHTKHRIKKEAERLLLFSLVPVVGLEPTRHR